ncbi:hypothetical protein GQ457_01G016550 [Hibiscus cannabinus]
MTQTSTYMARTNQFIQKTVAFMDGSEIDPEVAKGATHEQCKAITTRIGKSLNTPPMSRQGKETVAKPNAEAVPDNPASADAPAST